MNNTLAEAFVRAVEAARPLDPYATYPASVITDHGDMHYDLRPQDRRLPDLTRVPLYSAPPGLSYRITDATALLCFAGGNLDQPAVLGFIGGRLSSLNVQIGVSSLSITASAIKLDSAQILLGGAAAQPLKTAAGVTVKVRGA